MSIRRFIGVTAGLAVVATVLNGLTPSVAVMGTALRAPQQLADGAGPDVLVLYLAAAAAWLVWAWACAGLLLTAAGALPGTLGAVARLLARRLLPGAARRAAAMALGVGLGVSGPLIPTLALAAPAGAVGTSMPALGAPVPDWPSLAEASPAVPPAAPPPAPTAGAAPVSGVHVVTAGECLWQIAADQHRAGTGEEPTNAVVADAVRAWWATNAVAIGADPDLIHPGQVLRSPAGLPATQESR